MNTYLVEISGYDTVNSVVKTLYFSSASFPAFSSGDADRSNTFYEPRILDVGSIARRMFSTGTTYGRNTANGGIISIDNSDGAYDYLLDWGFDGRLIRVLIGDTGGDWSTFIEILNGTLTQPFFSFTKNSPASIDFVARDKNQELEVNIQDTLYLGTNSGATGDEGLVDDLKGSPKPLCFGHCFNVTPKQCNSSALRFQVHDGQINDVPALYDNGVTLTKVVTPPVAGQYSVDTATGIITLGGSPAGQITCDVEGYSPSGVYKTSVADICESILLNYGDIVAGDINSTAITNLNTANNDVVGIYIVNHRSISTVLDELCASVGGYWFFDRVGVYQTGQLTSPATSVKTYTDIEFVGIDRFKSSDVDKGIPVHNVILNYKKFYTVQNGDALAGSVTVTRTGELATEFRTSSSEDASVLTAHLLSPEIERDSLITVEVDALAEALRLLNLYKVRRDFFKIVVPRGDLLELGNTITIKSDRFGLRAGKNFVIIAITDQYPEDNLTELEIWG